MGGGHSATEKPHSGGGSTRSKSASVGSAYTSRPQPTCTNDDGFLTVQEQELVVKTWAIMSQDIVGNGVRVFTRIAELEPKVVEAFPFRNLTGEALLKSPLFKGHASRFMKAVEVTMDNLGALEVIVIPNLIHLGRQHTRIRGFKVEYLQIFQSAMVDIWSQQLDKQFRGATREGWMKIFSLISSNVLKGYEEGLKDMEQGTDRDSGAASTRSSGISSKSVELNANHKLQTTPDTQDMKEKGGNRTEYSNTVSQTEDVDSTYSPINNSQV